MAVRTGSGRRWLAFAGTPLWLLLALAVAWHPAAAAAAEPTVSIKPAPSSGSYANGQTVAVSVGPNSLFVPNSRINLIECADPGGSSANLPTSFIDCDENTVESDTVLVQADGSFSEQGYALYALPNATLGEGKSALPVCDRTHPCVLYLGENQNDFTKPKVFSPPFVFTSAAVPLQGGAPPLQSGAPAATPDPPLTSASAAAAVSLPPATLAFTGAPNGMGWMAGLGLVLAGAGVLGRRAVRGRPQ